MTLTADTRNMMDISLNFNDIAMTAYLWNIGNSILYSRQYYIDDVMFTEDDVINGKDKSHQFYIT